ncbi:MAG: hypothetical protein RMK65_07070 [Anaerolineae bacterium]|nr:hypothetical protein [Anaerolineae bacterium]MCX8067607.1 hypothetical protein [Anaerolineae bacterium]MDW7991881.1 hypothetical protein [Anaerolineae bacterium]
MAWIITACLVRRLIGGEDEIIARPNPETGQIENLEVLFCTARLLRREWFSVPVTADLRLIPSPAEVAEAAETDRR